MTDIPKKSRLVELRNRIDSQKGSAIARSGMTATELRALIDAYERRTKLLKEALDRVDDCIDAERGDSESSDRVNAWIENIDAELDRDL